MAGSGDVQGRPGFPAHALARILKRRLSVGLTLSAAVVALGAGSAAAVTGGQSAKVVITDGKLTPATATVAPGGQVEWSNAGTKSHRVTSDGGAWAAFTVARRKHHVVRFAHTGRFPYHVDGRLLGTVLVAAGTSATGPGKVYTFRGVRFDWRPQGAHYHEDISGRVCGQDGLGEWRLSLTATNYTDTSNTGTFHARVVVKKPRTSTRGAGTSGAHIRLTILPGSSLAIRVESSSSLGTHKATVPVRVGGTCPG